MFKLDLSKAKFGSSFLRCGISFDLEFFFIERFIIFFEINYLFDNTYLISKIFFTGAYDNLLKWPFAYRVSFYLLDQNNDPTLRKHIRFSIKPNPCADNEPFLGQPKKIEKNASFGGAKFALQEEVESRTYVKDDVIYLKIAVDCDGTAEP